MKAYDKIINFIARTAGPDELGAFRPSDALSKRVEELTRRHKKGRATLAKEQGLEHYLRIEHVMRLAKARALKTASRHA